MVWITPAKAPPLVRKLLIAGLLLGSGCTRHAATTIVATQIRATPSLPPPLASDRHMQRSGPPFFDLTVQITELSDLADPEPYIDVFASYCNSLIELPYVTLVTFPALSGNGILIGGDSRKLYNRRYIEATQHGGSIHAWLASRSWYGDDALRQTTFLPADGQDVCLNLQSGSYVPIVSKVLRIPFESFQAALRANPAARPPAQRTSG